MTLAYSDFESFRSHIEELQRRWSQEDEQEKISNRVTVRLARVYREADAPTQKMFDRVLADWVRSSEPGKCFDAKALIREFRICSALPAVREALAYWRAQLVQYCDFSRGGEYGLRRSHALSGVNMLESVVQELEMHCSEASASSFS